YSYNGVNVTRVDANNRTTQFNYLAFGDPSDARLISVVDAAGTTTTYQYAITGALRSVSGPAPGVQRTWVINDKGRPDSDTQPESGTTTYTYDAAGNLASTTNANGQMTTFTYDANNRLLTRDGPGTADDLSITYDNANHIDRVLSMTGGGVLTTNTYNTAGTLATQVVQTSIGPASSSYAYDADDNLISIVYPSGREVSYAYDGENRLTTINQKPYGASTSSVFAHDFTYGGDGHLASYVTGAVT